MVAGVEVVVVVVMLLTLVSVFFYMFTSFLSSLVLWLCCVLMVAVMVLSLSFLLSFSTGNIGMGQPIPHQTSIAFDAVFFPKVWCCTAALLYCCGKDLGV